MWTTAKKKLFQYSNSIQCRLHHFGKKINYFARWVKAINTYCYYILFIYLLFFRWLFVAYLDKRRTQVFVCVSTNCSHGHEELMGLSKKTKRAIRMRNQKHKMEYNKLLKWTYNVFFGVFVVGAAVAGAMMAGCVVL